MQLTELVHLVDQFVEVRTARLEADKLAKDLKMKETKLAERIIAAGQANEAHFIGGTTMKVTIGTKRKPIAEDWPSVYTYMQENDAMDLLQKRLSEAAISAREEDGVHIPGISYINVDKLTVSKI